MSAEVVRVLEAGLDLLRKGICRGRLVDVDGSLCSLGAIRKSAGLGNDVLFCDAAGYLYRATGAKTIKDWHDASDDDTIIAGWVRAIELAKAGLTR